MRLILIILVFLKFDFIASSQTYKSNLVTNLNYDSEKSELVFRHSSNSSSLIIPSFSTHNNYYMVTYPKGDIFNLIGLGFNSGTTTIEPKQDYTIRQEFYLVLLYIEEMTRSLVKEGKQLIPQSGTYKVDWIVTGLPTKTIQFDYKN